MARKGEVTSEETKAKISASRKKSGSSRIYGPLSEETKAKILATKIKNGTLHRGMGSASIAQRAETSRINGTVLGFQKGYKQTPEHTEASRLARIGYKQTPEHIAKVKKTCEERGFFIGKVNIGRKLTPAHRKKLVDSWLDPNSKRTIHTVKIHYYKNIRMRSLSEVRCATILDDLGILWQYEPRRFRLSWTTYLPDFYLPEMDIWIEVKGYMTELSQHKVDSFRSELNKSMAVVMYGELLELSEKRANL